MNSYDRRQTLIASTGAATKHSAAIHTPASHTPASHTPARKARALRTTKALLLAVSTIAVVDQTGAFVQGATLGYVPFSGGTYSQGFDSLAYQSGTSLNSNNPITINNSTLASPTNVTYTLPATVAAPSATPGTYSLSDTSLGNGVALSNPKSGDAGLDGWWSTSVVTTDSNATVANRYAATPGDQTTGGLISFGGLSSSNRAAGLISTGTTGATEMGLALQNTSGAAITQFSLAYTGELWRQQTAQKYLHFGYLITPTNVTSNTVNSGAIPTSGTTGDTKLDVVFATGTAANGATSGTPVNTQAISDTISGINWAPNTTLWLTWETYNASNVASAAGSSQGVGIDNLTFSLNSSGPVITTQTDVWSVGAGSGAWDTVTSNWTISGTSTPTTYSETRTNSNPDAVVFPDTLAGGNGTINVTAAAVSPTSIAVQNNTGSYTIIGNPINGAATLTKTGNGTLTLSPTTSNGYTGGTVINGGQVVISKDSALGAATGGVTLNGGSLIVNSAITSARSLSFGANGGTLVIGANAATFGSETGTGTFTTVGSGNLTFTGSFSQNGAMSLGTGSLIFTGNIQSNGGTITFNPGTTGNTLNGNVVLASQAYFNIIGNGASTSAGSLSGNGSILVQSTGSTITNVGKESATLGSTVLLNSTDPTGARFTAGSVTGATFQPGSFATIIGGTTASTGTFIVAGPVTGYSDVVISNDPKAGGGSGALMINTPMTYQGTTVINVNAGIIVAGTNNPLPTTTNIITGGSNTQAVDNIPGDTNTGTIGLCSFDLAGHNQTISSISDGDLYGVGSSAAGLFRIVNSSGTASTLTLSGSTSPTYGFNSGAIGGGTASNNINLVKGGTNTIALDGTETYTGSTTVRGGTLSIGDGTTSSISPSIASGSITLVGTDSAATLALYSSTALANGSTTAIAVSTAGNAVSIVLAFTGQQNVNIFSINGVNLPNGVYGASNEPAADPTLFSGSGMINVVPEPTSLGVLALGGLGLLTRKRRRQMA